VRNSEVMATTNALQSAFLHSTTKKYFAKRWCLALFSRLPASQNASNSFESHFNCGQGISEYSQQSQSIWKMLNYANVGFAGMLRSLNQKSWKCINCLLFLPLLSPRCLFDRRFFRNTSLTNSYSWITRGTDVQGVSR